MTWRENLPAQEGCAETISTNVLNIMALGVLGSSGPGLPGHYVLLLDRTINSHVTVPLSILALVFQRLDNAIQRIKRYPADKC